jgi:hypothetical protein
MKKQKQARSNKQALAMEGLLVQEASQLITEPVEAVQPPTPPPVYLENRLYSHVYEQHQSVLSVEE